MAVGKEMDRLLTLIDDADEQERKSTNWWLTKRFLTLAAGADVERYIEDDIPTDDIFCNMVTRIPYDTLVGMNVDKVQPTSIIRITHAYS